MTNTIINVDNQEDIEKRILVIRGVQVMLDSDVADLFGVESKRINQQMKRNVGRFPKDFCFQLSLEEYKDLKSHFATSFVGAGGKTRGVS